MKIFIISIFVFVLVLVPRTGTAQHQLFNTEIPIFDAIISDFQVNENAGPIGAEQEYPSIAIARNGYYVATWVDWRNGDADIYAQRYSNDNSALGPNFKVNEDQRGAELEHPSVSMDGDGNFVITWIESDDERRKDIYAQRYASDGSALGSNFKINDVQKSVDPWRYSISTNSNGNFVIAWVDCRNGNFDIYAQLYSSYGSALGKNVKVNDQEGVNKYKRPSISTAGNGSFVITWVDERLNRHFVYAQRYASDGTALGNNFKVNDNEGGQWEPSIAMDSYGNFVIAWANSRNENTAIFMQRYSSDGNAVGTNFKINDDLGGAWRPSVFVDGNDNFVILWEDSRNGERHSDIYAQRYSSDGSAIGPNYKVNFDYASVYGRVFEPRSFSISVDDSSNFVIAWAELKDGDIDLYAQRNSSDGSTSGSEFKINDDQESAYQGTPSISTDNSGNFIIAWADCRNGKRDIYVQRFSQNGTTLESNFKVNDNEGFMIGGWSTPHSHPSISTDHSGNFVITWVDGRNYGDIYAQRYSNDGVTLGANFRVNENQARVAIWSPSISTNDNGNFVITWRAGPNEGDLYAQRYSNDGVTLGDNFRVNDIESGVSACPPSISINDNGNFIITWTSGSRIYAQRYSDDGSAVGMNFKVSADGRGVHQIYPSISTNGNGKFMIAWEVSSVENHDIQDIYAQPFSSDGTAIGQNFRVNDDRGSADQGSPSIATDDDGNFVITWVDARNGNPDIYAQRFSSDGATVGRNFRVTNTSNKSQFSPDVKLCNNRIYTTWTDNRVEGTGYDVWANVLDWEFPATGICDKEQSLPSVFMLSQNYPNPFNVSTKISYSIPTSGFVILKIYDLLGKEMKTLVNEFQNAAFHSVSFDASKLTSGIYFYRLQVGSEVAETKQMLFIK
jgi:hypothetical protein